MTDFRGSFAGRRQAWFGLKKHVKNAASYRLPHAVLRTASRFIPKLRSGRLPAPRHLQEVTGRVDGVTYVMLRPDRCEIAKELYWGEGKRPRPEDANALEIVAHLALDADVFVDIGAYTGVFTLATAVANPAIRVHAFEIVSAVADLLDANVRRNGVAERTVIHREGIGVPGATMLVPTGEGGSALPSFFSSKMTFVDGVTVRFRSLDSLEDSLSPDDRVIMKIDVEGTELDVFEHGREFLAAHRPDILCEVLYGRSNAEALNAILSPIGYKFLLVRERGVSPRRSISADPRFRDWLFTPRTNDLPSSLGVSAEVK